MYTLELAPCLFASELTSPRVLSEASLLINLNNPEECCSFPVRVFFEQKKCYLIQRSIHYYYYYYFCTLVL